MDVPFRHYADIGQTTKGRKTWNKESPGEKVPLGWSEDETHDLIKDSDIKESLGVSRENTVTYPVTTLLQIRRTLIHKVLIRIKYPCSISWTSDISHRSND